MSAYGFDPSQKDASAMFVPGTIKEEPATGSTASTFENSGPRRWRYVKAGGALTLGAPATITTSAVNYLSVTNVTAATIATRVAGIAQQAFDSGEYGWVLCFGLGTVKVATGAGTSNAGDMMVTDAGNIGVDSAAADEGAEAAEIIGHFAATIAAEATGLAFIRCE